MDQKGIFVSRNANGVSAPDCTEPNRAAFPRRCIDFCNKAETEREGELPPGVKGTAK